MFFHTLDISLGKFLKNLTILLNAFLAFFTKPSTNFLNLSLWVYKYVKANVIPVIANPQGPSALATLAAAATNCFIHPVTFTKITIEPITLTKDLTVLWCLAKYAINFADCTATCAIYLPTC